MIHAFRTVLMWWWINGNGVRNQTASARLDYDFENEMTIIADRTNDLHQRCFVSVRLVVSPFYSSMLGVAMLGVLGFTLQPVTQGALVFCTSSVTSHKF